MNTLSAMTSIFVGIAVVLVGPAFVRAQVPVSQPASTPATASAPADEALDPAVDAILNRLEKKGDQIDSLEAARPAWVDSVRHTLGEFEYYTGFQWHRK